MANLKKETLEDLKDGGYKPEDIEWVGCNDFTIPTDLFWKLADYEYDSGFGSQEVATDLIIVLKDGSYLERHEYDGSEWWELKRSPKKPQAHRDDIKYVVRGSSMWDTLKEMQEREDD